MQRNQEIFEAPAAHLSSKLCKPSCCFWFCFPGSSGSSGTNKSHFFRCFLLPHAIMEPEGWFFLHLEDLVWCIPELFVLIIQSKKVVAQRGHSWHKNIQIDESQSSSAHPHPKVKKHKANIGSWTETDTGISLKQIGWGGAVTLGQPMGFGWIKQIISGVKMILKFWFCPRSELQGNDLKPSSCPGHRKGSFTKPTTLFSALFY